MKFDVTKFLAITTALATAAGACTIKQDGEGDGGERSSGRRNSTGGQRDARGANASASS